MGISTEIRQIPAEADHTVVLVDANGRVFIDIDAVISAQQRVGAVYTTAVKVAEDDAVANQASGAQQATQQSIDGFRKFRDRARVEAID